MNLNPFGVATGQVWESCDRRDRGYHFLVIEVDKTHAIVRNKSTGRRSRIALTRFKSNSTGYRQVSPKSGLELDL